MLSETVDSCYTYHVEGVASARVLIIDDDVSLLTAFKRYLGRTHHVDTVSGGQEALSVLERGERYDILLCDLTMPEMEGTELYEILLQRFPDQAQRVVFMTGGDYRSPVLEFYQEVPVRCLEKPIELQQLVSIVDLAARGGLPRYSREKQIVS